jgi:hypothetical protein
MVTDSRRGRKPTPIDLPTASATIPSPELVRDMAAEIRDSWTPRERRRRAHLARTMMLRQLIASGP